MKRILVLTDFSDPSNSAVEVAFNLAVQSGSEVTIYHRMTKHTNVIFPLDKSNNYSIYDITEEKLINSLKDWSERAERDKVKTFFLSAGGKLVEGVNNYCKRNNTDLVIMGSTGRSKIQEQWGSNTEKMVKYIHYPLLIIKDKVENVVFKKIIYASSFNIKEKPCFLKLSDLIPIDENGIIHFVSIDTDSFFTQPSILIHQAMEDYVELTKPLKSKKHFYQDYNVRAGIRHFAGELNPDLVVMSNKERKPIKRILLGNDAIDVAHTLKFPVLIINYPE